MALNIKADKDRKLGYKPNCPICKGEPIDLELEYLKSENKRLIKLIEG